MGVLNDMNNILEGYNIDINNLIGRKLLWNFINMNFRRLKRLNVRILILFFII